MKQFLSLALVAFAMSFIVACSSSEAGDTKANAKADATPAKTETKADATPAKTDAPAEDLGPTTTIEFEESVFDFGTVNEGDKVEHIYKFKNTGNEPLKISSAKGSCGCTVPEWPKEPIAPGAGGEIKVVFNTKGKKNNQTKAVTITANTDPNPTRITIKGVVTPADDAAKK